MLLTVAKIELDKATVEKLVLASGSRITLIGTAHVSKESSKQVKRIIQDTRPDVVMVEIDKSRLNQLGYKTLFLWINNKAICHKTATTRLLGGKFLK
jgi:pheromone shutdown protein TraB